MIQSEGGGNVTRGEQWSKALFNNLHLLRVASAIAEGDRVFDSRSLQIKLSLSQTAVHRVLCVLEGVELLERQTRSSRTVSVPYVRTEHPFWNAAVSLSDAAEAR